MLAMLGQYRGASRSFQLKEKIREERRERLSLKEPIEGFYVRTQGGEGDSRLITSTSWIDIE